MYASRIHGKHYFLSRGHYCDSRFLILNITATCGCVKGQNVFVFVSVFLFCSSFTLLNMQLFGEICLTTGEQLCNCPFTPLEYSQDYRPACYVTRMMCNMSSPKRETCVMMIGPPLNGFMDTLDQSMAFMQLSRDHLLLIYGSVHVGRITNISVMSKKTKQQCHLDRLCTCVDTFHVCVRHSEQQLLSA